jgi:hypothetical protein
VHRPRGGSAPRRVSPLSRKKWRCHTTMVTGQSGDPNLLQIEIHHFKAVELFISFLKSPRSSKSEFRARSYTRNSKGCCCCFWALPLALLGGGSALSGAHRKGRCHPLQWLQVGYELGCNFRPQTTKTLPFLLLFDSKLIHINSNNFSFAIVPTPPSVHHLVHVC